MKRKRQTITCADCGRDNQTHQGRGLCAKCSWLHKKQGTLAKFPKKGKAVKPKRPKPDPVALTGGYWHPNPRGIQRWHDTNKTMHDTTTN